MYLYSFFNLGAGLGGGVNATPRPLYAPVKRPGTHYTGGWMGLRADLDAEQVTYR